MGLSPEVFSVMKTAIKETGIGRKPRLLVIGIDFAEGNKDWKQRQSATDLKMTRK